MRGTNVRPIFFWSSIAVLMALLAGLALGSASLPGETAPSPSSAPRAATAPPAALPGVLVDSRGFIAVSTAGAPATIRRETSADAVARLHGQGFVGSVSATGRRVAYWVTMNGATEELRVLDVTAPEQETPLATLRASERGTAAVWSDDRTGVVVSVEPSGKPGGGDEPGPFSALRIIDAPTRMIHEIARLTDGSRFVPVGWDRTAQLVGACVVGPDGVATAYAVIGEDAQHTETPMAAGTPIATVDASAGRVLGVVNGAVIRVWATASYDAHDELGAAPGEGIAAARWRPGAGDIVVSVADRLELWPPEGGDHRVVARGLPAATGLVVTSDGAVAILSFDSGRSAVAVDIASGRTAPVPMAGEQLLAAISLR